MLTNKDLASFCVQKTVVATKYMWGDYGRRITLATITAKAKQYPSRYSTARQAELKKYINKAYGCDCAGLIKWFLWTDNDYHAIKYDAKTDRNCTGLYDAAKVKGKIDTLPETPGLLVWMKGHVGVYVGGGKAVECTLGSYGDGVVMTNVKGRGWTHWLQLPEISYEDKTDNTIKVGSVVTIVDGATWYSGKSIPAWVKKKALIVRRIKGERVVIDKSVDGKNAICSPINIKYLALK